MNVDVEGRESLVRFLAALRRPLVGTIWVSPTDSTALYWRCACLGLCVVETA
jgi:hypothetical protein